jgi:hypothetical protein
VLSVPATEALPVAIPSAIANNNAPKTNTAITAKNLEIIRLTIDASCGWK